LIHTVRSGDCLSSIGATYGLDWNKIWTHPANGDLRAKRKNPNVLYPGDVVFIPEKESKQEACATGNTHRFVKNNPLAKLKLRLLMNGRPRPNLPFELYAENSLIAKGMTDSEGFVAAKIPGALREARLSLVDGALPEAYHLKLGALDPVDTESGAKQRLTNLGFAVQDDLQAAIKEFQSKMNLAVTGSLDSQTAARLEKEYGL
jgi:N-acetylmuramoyl-L-alanine amidase